ncbi:MAG: ATP-binding protein, partial [Dehalococcoidia bacterium]
MPPSDPPRTAARVTSARPWWSEVLQALREARGVTQDGWAAHLGVSRKTVQRWEAGERVPDPGAEAGLLAYCSEKGLFRPFDRGPLAGVSLTAESLQALLAEARTQARRRLQTEGRRDSASAVTPTATEPANPSDDHLKAQPEGLSPSGRILPAPISSFVGREQELATVRRKLGGTRLLTLTGIGGCGKTRLALQVAGELLWAYPSGVWFVELATLADPALVPQTVGAALDLHPTGQQPIIEVLLEHLAQRHLLLILDNCEHLLGACAALVETLLRACPHLEVVTTSREPLGITGETVWRVPPLSLPDATRLFIERSQSYQPDVDLTAAIEEICEQLDGVPLAIELAAARVRALSVEQIAARLSDRFRLLTGGSRTALPRQQTLRATMDWSHDLLTAPEQTLL